MFQDSLVNMYFVFYVVCFVFEWPQQNSIDFWIKITSNGCSYSKMDCFNVKGVHTICKTNISLIKFKVFRNIVQHLCHLLKFYRSNHEIIFTCHLLNIVKYLYMKTGPNEPNEVMHVRREFNSSRHHILWAQWHQFG